MTEPIKPKRKLKAIDFSSEDSHIALVHKDQGGPASGADYRLVLKAANKESKPIADTVVVADTSNKTNEVIKNEVSENDPVIIKQTNKENKMEEIEILQKSLNEQKEQLQKALDQIKTFEAEKKEAIAKSRKAEIVSAVKDEGKSEVLFKALKDSNDEDFTAVVKALKEISAAVEKSELFVEKGVQVEEKSKPEVNHVEALLKAKYAAK